MAKTYADLTEDVLQWCYIQLGDNSQLKVEKAIPVAIRLGEELLYHDVGVLFPEMLTEETRHILPDFGSFVVPDDCLRVVKFRRGDGEDSDILRKTSREIVRQVAARIIVPADNRPVWAIDSKKIHFAPLTTELPTTTFTLEYFAEPPYMGAAGTGTEPPYFDRYYSIYFAASKHGMFKFLSQHEQAQVEYDAVARQVKRINNMALLRYAAAGG